MRMHEPPQHTFRKRSMGRFIAAAGITVLLVVMIWGSTMNPQWFVLSTEDEEPVIEDPDQMVDFDLLFLQSNLQQGLNKEEVIARLGHQYTSLGSFVDMGKATGESWRYDYGIVGGYEPYYFTGHEGWADVAGMQRGLLAGQLLIQWNQDEVATVAVSYSDESGTIQFAMLVDGNADHNATDMDVLAQFERRIGVVDIRNGIEFTRSGFHYTTSGVKRTTIPFHHDGVDVDLEFQYVELEDRIVVLHPLSSKPGAGYLVTSYPGTNLSLIEYGHSIYTVDVQNGQIDKFLHDRVADFDIKQSLHKFQQYHDAGGDPNYWMTWGARPSFNPSVNKTLFMTSRNDRDEIWIKDLITGDETLLWSEPYWVIGWVNDEEVIMRSAFEILKGNTTTKQTTSYGIATHYEFRNPYLILQRVTDELQWVNVGEDVWHTYNHADFHYATQMSLHPSRLLLAVVDQPNRITLERNLLLLDLENGESFTLIMPEGVSAGPVRWLDEQIVLLTIGEAYKEETLLIDIAKLGF